MMKKLFLTVLFLVSSSLEYGMDSTEKSGIDFEGICVKSPEMWERTRQKLVELGMDDQDFGENVQGPLEELTLTSFWESKKEETSQEEKDKLLKTILGLDYRDFWKYKRRHIAFAVEIGADLSTLPDNVSFVFFALDLACSYKDAELVAFLLQKGADPNYRPSERFPLYEVFCNKNELIARLLMAHGAQPQEQLKNLIGKKEMITWFSRIAKKSLLFATAKVVLKKYDTVDNVRKDPLKLPAELYEYLEETNKILN